MENLANYEGYTGRKAVEAVGEHARLLRESVIESCIFAMCDLCARGSTPLQEGLSGQFFHDVGVSPNPENGKSQTRHILCAASPIRSAVGI